jgi:2,4-dienoyl-CoA reductase-like NADH-dependent reductase (Old Yellow Enzyme family)
MTRGRATKPQLTPTELDVDYFTQRASAGLIITGSNWVVSNGSSPFARTNSGEIHRKVVGLVRRGSRGAH